MKLPLSQNCSTFGDGPVGIYGDTCNDIAEYVTAGVVICGIIAATVYRRNAIFSAALIGTSLIRCLYGATIGFSSALALIFASREVYVPVLTWILTWGHTFFRDSDLSVTGCITFCATYAIALAYTTLAGMLATTAAVCTATGTDQPLLAYFLFDLSGILLGIIWLLFGRRPREDGSH